MNAREEAHAQQHIAAHCTARTAALVRMWLAVAAQRQRGNRAEAGAEAEAVAGAGAGAGAGAAALAVVAGQTVEAEPECDSRRPC